MKKIIIPIIIFSIIFQTNIFAQTINKNTLNQPKVDIKVKIKRDADGNIIQYDSTYTETYKSSNLQNVNIDSLMAEFNKNFEDFGFANNFFPDFTDIQKQMMTAFPDMSVFCPSDSIFFNFPQMLNFDELEKFFNDNQINNGVNVVPQSQQQSKAIKQQKPKLNPANTYQF